MSIDFSVVIPVKDEEGNVAALLEEIRRALAGRAFEVVFVDDCSSDATVKELEACRSSAPELRILCHSQNCGQSTAIRSGVLAARGATVITLDGDGQNNPADIPRLLAIWERKDRPARLAMVAGQRLKRRDTAGKRLASWIANGVRSRVLKDGTRDTGCGLKVFSREAFLRLPYFTAMHRFLPALMRREGYALDFVDVESRARRAGQSKYRGFRRALQAVPDLVGVMWLLSRTRLPTDVREI